MTKKLALFPYILAILLIINGYVEEQSGNIWLGGLIAVLWSILMFALIVEAKLLKTENKYHGSDPIP